MAYYGIFFAVATLGLMLYIHAFVESVNYLSAISNTYLNLSSIVNYEASAYSIGRLESGETGYVYYILKLNNINYSCAGDYCIIYNAYDPKVFIPVSIR